MTVRCAVYGTGSWGTAFAAVLADAGCQVSLWGRRPDLVAAINAERRNPETFPDRELPPSVTATADPAQAAADAEFVFLAVPSQSLRANLASWAPLLRPDAVLVSLMKGVELGTAKRMSEVIEEIVTGTGTAAGARAGGPDPAVAGRIAVLSGPNLAPEIAARQPAAAVVACTDEAVARRIQSACHTGYFRPYTNTDVVGCELGGAVKNVIALAVGIAAGMGMGDNTKASLITRGLAETTRLGLAMGADAHTFAGLAGMGDLVATCSSPLSRNNTFGRNLGRGMSLAETIAVTSQTAEGVKSCESVADLARRHGVDMPITETVVDIVHNGKPPVVAVKELMSRSAKPER
ncbi:NAD(P)H-dependent glycerol-3-phosphate dehydrogenase [Actinacidiphila sp. DG2A-62]|jgi:glycerol-3-phosphate dehydrogenase (NAD(P)+)|uniref:NAD(P)H-dependent glycerol-3-phosphate dehydrogenase n=1 Tax=Actinacidiphila sp. DG2A-62 TaxID=3108821 RepID=UPI002DB84168|nr:NAD(P)H-dependent glycerol-3-phosphate dehydrogenase [Actinacidiphila sp. DG2A-62]MEC3997413.1 NAD(P)H-dependent glycerol-3-phosphate dehydrogenase [Actinacidiphila sp. DG2A-62]